MNKEKIYQVLNGREKIEVDEKQSALMELVMERRVVAVASSMKGWLAGLKGGQEGELIKQEDTLTALVMGEENGVNMKGFMENYLKWMSANDESEFMLLARAAKAEQRLEQALVDDRERGVVVEMGELVDLGWSRFWEVSGYMEDEDEVWDRAISELMGVREFDDLSIYSWAWLGLMMRMDYEWEKYKAED